MSWIPRDTSDVGLAPDQGYDADNPTPVYNPDTGQFEPGAPAATAGPTPDVSRLPGYLDGTWKWNASASAQQYVWTEADGIRYAVWYDDSRNPIIGKQAAGQQAWETFDLSTVSGNPLGAPAQLDIHMKVVLVVDGDGVVHVAGNFHNQSWRSVRTTTAGDITAWTDQSSAIGGSSSSGYAQFVRLLNGDVLAFWREGTSGDGDIYFNRWDGSTWGTKVELLDGTTSSENPYLHRIAVDRGGRIHLFCVWRSTSGADTNSDFSYLRSDDNGETWRQTDGTQYTLPVTHAAVEVAVSTAATGSGLLNAGGCDADASGNPHASIMLHDGSDNTQLNHVWHDGTDWNIEAITDLVGKTDLTGGTFAVEIAHGTVICPAHGGTAIVYRSDWEPTNGLYVTDVTVAGSPSKRLLLGYDLDRYDVTMDEGASRFHDRLTIMTVALKQSEGGSDFEHKAGYIMSWPAALLAVEDTVSDVPDPVPADAATTYADEVSADSPFAWWRLEETSGSTASDEESTHDGTVTGADLNVSGASGTGSAASFDGSNDSIDVGTLGAFGSSCGSTTTFEVWAKWTATGVMCIGGVLNDGSTEAVTIMANARGRFGATAEPGQVSITFRAGGQDQRARASARTDLNDGEWHHLVFRRAGDTDYPDVIVDGVLDNGPTDLAANTGGWSNFDYGFTWGGRNNRGTVDQHFDGDLDEPAVYQTELSVARADAHYDAGVA